MCVGVCVLWRFAFSYCIMTEFIATWGRSLNGNTQKGKQHHFYAHERQLVT